MVAASSFSRRFHGVTHDKPQSNTFPAWNRRIHFCLGLYFLLFLWLFSFTGLLLDHGGWSFAEFWPQRKQSQSAHKIVAPPAGSDLEQARDIMRQLGIRGEIDWTQSRNDQSRLNFCASRPGTILEIRADLQQGRAEVQSIELNGWGVIHILHTYTGVGRADDVNDRDWLMTKILAFSMDALAGGLIVMRLGLVILGLGTVTWGWFVAGLRWFKS